MAHVIPAPATVALTVVGTEDRFPVHRIWCVGRNYSAHAIEMGGNPDREPPFFFMKSPATLLEAPADVPYPPATQNLHYEIELVLALGTGGRDIAEDKALDHVYGYAVGLDLTRRDLQWRARERGQPWDLSKNFPGSTPIGPIHAAADSGHLNDRRIWLEVDGRTVQESNIANMTWSPAEIIVQLSKQIPLTPGDLIFTGTPEGVGPLSMDATLKGAIDGLAPVEARIVP